MNHQHSQSSIKPSNNAKKSYFYSTDNNPSEYESMKQFLPIIFLLSCSFSFGQFAIVIDKDSLVNIREDGQQNSKVVDRLPKGHLIYCFENKGNWTNIDYTNRGKELNAYVYKDRYKLVSSFPALKIFKKTTNAVTLKLDSITVTISQCTFDPKKHKFKYFKEDPKQIELIDNKNYWGTDGDIPTSQFEKITIKFGQRIIALPQSALEGLYEPNIFTAEVNYDQTKDSLYIQTMNSDAAGAYLVIWKVEKGVYKNRLVANGF